MIKKFLVSKTLFKVMISFKKDIKNSIIKINPNLVNIIKLGNIFPDLFREYIFNKVKNKIFKKRILIMNSKIT